MQDFLLTPLLHEAVTYKLAHQIHNLRPEKEYTLGPLDMFPAGITDAADWRNLIFGGWWSWLEVGEIGEHFPRGLLPLCGRQVVTHHSVLTPRPLSRTRIQPQPIVGIGAWAGRFSYAILSRLEEIQATFCTRGSSTAQDSSATTKGLRAFKTTGTTSARISHRP